MSNHTPYGYPSSNALYTPAGYIARADFLIEKNYLLLSPYFYNKSMQAVSCPSGFLQKRNQGENILLIL
jgi:hypothetical protein